MIMVVGLELWEIFMCRWFVQVSFSYFYSLHARTDITSLDRSVPIKGRKTLLYLSIIILIQ